MMQLMSKLNANVEKMAASQMEIRNIFPALPERNPKCQKPGSSLGGPAKAIIILRSGKTLERDHPPPTPMVEDEEDDEVDEVGKSEKSKERVVKEEEIEGETDKPEKEGPSEGKFVRRPGKEPMVEEATRHPLPAPYPKRLKMDQQEIKSQ